MSLLVTRRLKRDLVPALEMRISHHVCCSPLLTMSQRVEHLYTFGTISRHTVNHGPEQAHTPKDAQ